MKYLILLKIAGGRNLFYEECCTRVAWMTKRCTCRTSPLLRYAALLYDSTFHYKNYPSNHPKSDSEHCNFVILMEEPSQNSFVQC